MSAARPTPYPLRIEVRPLLVPGMMGGGPRSIFIFLCKGLAREEAILTLWHEIVHVLLMAGGQPQPHDEAGVERLAAKLAAACPEVLALCGVDSHFEVSA